MSQTPWRVAAASVRGSAHERAGLPCQDAHQWAAGSGELVVAAVADGAGSAAAPEVGADVAVRTAVESVCRKLAALPSAALLEDAGWEQLLAGVLAEAKAAVEAEAQARSLASADLACTLIALIAGRDFVAAVQIGDGAVIVAEAGGSLLCLTRPPLGEYLNETTFLTSSAALGSARPVVWRGPVSHLAIISDGLQMAALRMPAAEPHAGFFRPLFGFLDAHQDASAAQAGLAAFLVSPRVRERTDDDLTLILATPVS